MTNLTIPDIDRKSVNLINAAVEKVVTARRMGVPMGNILANHERLIAGIYDWRDQQHRRVSSFGATAASALTTATYNATVQQAQLQQKDATAALKANYNATVKQINAQIAVSKKAKDTATTTQLTAYLKQAKDAYTAGVSTINASEKQAVVQAKADKASATVQSNQPVSVTSGIVPEPVVHTTTSLLTPNLPNVTDMPAVADLPPESSSAVQEPLRANDPYFIATVARNAALMKPTSTPPTDSTVTTFTDSSGQQWVRKAGAIGTARNKSNWLLVLSTANATTQAAIAAEAATAQARNNPSLNRAPAPATATTPGSSVVSPTTSPTVSSTPTTTTLTDPSNGRSYVLPSAPYDGQAVANADGTTFRYSASSNQWYKVVPATILPGAVMTPSPATATIPITSGSIAPAATSNYITLSDPNTGNTYQVPSSAYDGQQVANADGTVLQYSASTNQWNFVTSSASPVPVSYTPSTPVSVPISYPSSDNYPSDYTGLLDSSSFWNSLAPAASVTSPDNIILTDPHTGTQYTLPAYPYDGQSLSFSDGMTLYYSTSINQWNKLPVATTSVMTPVTADGAQQVGSDGTVYQYDAQSAQWYPVQASSDLNQLDVFQGNDAWSGGYGSSAIAKINRFGAVPRNCVGGFGQWAALATSLIGIAANLGSTVASMEIQHAILGTTAAPQAKPATAAPIVAAVAPTSTTDYTPWMIGGGIAAGALILILAMKKGKK